MSPTDPPTAAAHTAPAPPRCSTGMLCSLVLLLSVGVFAPTLLNGYTFDDPHYARRSLSTGAPNPMVAELRPFWEYWTVPMNHGVEGRCRGFRPLTVYSYALANALAGDPGGQGEDNAWLQHGINLILHGLATWLVFLLLRGLCRAGPALAAAALFGVHALHSGPVAAIVGRGELLAFVCGAAATLSFARSLRPDAARPRLAAALAGVLLLFACGSKESAIAWTVFAPLYAQVKGCVPRRNLGRAALCLLPALLLFLLLRAQVLATHVAPLGTFWIAFDANPLHHLELLPRICSATWIYLHGLAKVCWPYGLSSMYGDGVFPILDSLLAPRFLLAAGVLLGLLTGGWFLRRHQPMLALATAAFFGFSILTANLLFPIETIFGDRLYYSSVLGLSLGVAWLWQRALSMPRPLRLGLLGLWLLWIAYNAQYSVSRSLAWRGNLSLTQADLVAQPDSVSLRVDLANLKLWNFDKPGAIAELRRALAARPHSPLVLRSLAAQLPPAEAEALLRRALHAKTLVPGAEGRKVRWALGSILEARGAVEAACALYEEALATCPELPNIRLHLMHLYARRGETDRLAALVAACPALPLQSPFYELYRGVLAHRRGRHPQAVQILSTCLPRLPLQVQSLHGYLYLAASQQTLGLDAAAAQAIAKVTAHAQQNPGLEEHLQELQQARPPR